jgi:putative ABC transport system permease protein
VAGRFVLVARLLGRDLRRRPVDVLLLLIAIVAATATLTVGRSLGALVDDPYRQTRVATAGPDVTVEPIQTGPDALAALAPLATAPGVTAHSGPFPLAYLTLTARDVTVNVVVEGRDAAPAALDRPAVTDGSWVRPGGVVVERSFAGALNLRLGDTVAVNGRRLAVTGFAATAARPLYPQVGWHQPGTVVGDSGGLVWVDRADVAALAGAALITYTMNLKLEDPDGGDAFIHAPANHPRLRGWQVRSWQQIAAIDDRQNAQTQLVLGVGSWMLTLLAGAGVAAIVAGRIVGQRRRVGLLKAVGAGPVLIAGLNLAEYLVIGLAGAALGLAAGWFAAPRLFRPSAGLLGAADLHPPARVAVAAVELAVAIAVAATSVPVVRAAATSTVRALADAPPPPRRRRLQIWLSRRLPTALLIGVRINARRPRRARLVTVNTLITATALAAVLAAQARPHHGIHGASLAGAGLPDPRDERTLQAMHLVAAMVYALALFNTVVNTWTSVLDVRAPLAVARALGATPGQAGLGLAVAQVLPALPGVVVGLPFGLWLYRALGPADAAAAPTPWLLAAALGVLLAVAALTAGPALATARRPVAEALP